MFKKYIFLFALFSLFAVSVYAVASDTLITKIAGQQSTHPGSSNTRITTLGGSDRMQFINKGNDANSIGDYFTGYYYDPAYGMFKMNGSTNTAKNVQVSALTVSSCGSQYNGYKLSGYSYNPDFGFVNFAHDANNYVYICIPKDANDDSLTTSLHGYAYSPNIGFQNFDGIILDSSVDLTPDHDAEGRFLKVDGNVSSENTDEVIADQFTDDLRVIGKITKSSLKKDMQQKIFSSIKNVTASNGSYNVSGLGASAWGSGDGAEILGNKVLVFKNAGGRSVEVSGNNNISGEKTLVVEGGDIYITGNIRGSGLLGIAALRQGNQGGNIYIHPDVTDIHAFIYADRAVLSADDANSNGIIESSEQFDGTAQASELKDQLYIKGSVFSENTIGGSVANTCPFYISTCNADTAKKYDLNYLRKYILVQPVDGDGNPVGDKNPQFNGRESFMGDVHRDNTDTQKPGYRKFPIIIEYDSRIQQTPPPFFN